MVKVFLDSADFSEMRQAALSAACKGFTCNPSLMRKAGVRDYHAFAMTILTAFPKLPISLEVIADDFGEMEQQALKLASWGSNIFVKIPVMNTRGQSSAPLIKRLAWAGVKVNVTAVFSFLQVNEVLDALNTATPAIVSIFAGRIADTGRNPKGTIMHAVNTRRSKQIEILWASTRQVFDVYAADALGCDIVTVSKEIFEKLTLEGKNLVDYSRETVKMFHRDAQAAGYSL